MKKERKKGGERVRERARECERVRESARESERERERISTWNFKSPYLVKHTPAHVNS